MDDMIMRNAGLFTVLVVVVNGSATDDGLELEGNGVGLTSFLDTHKILGLLLLASGSRVGGDLGVSERDEICLLGELMRPLVRRLRHKLFVGVLGSIQVALGDVRAVGSSGCSRRSGGAGTSRVVDCTTLADIDSIFIDAMLCYAMYTETTRLLGAPHGMEQDMDGVGSAGF
jgi:hypothetical protein